MSNFFFSSSALIGALFGGLGLGYIPSYLLTSDTVKVDQPTHLTSFLLADSNAVEVDGIRFEIIVPERVWIIPEKHSSSAIPVKIGLRITNQKPTPIRLMRFDPSIVLGLGIVRADGLPVKGEAARGMFLGLRKEQLTCPLLLSGKSVTFFLDANLYWRDNLLHLGGTDGLGGGWDFEVLKPGTYKIQFLYNNSSGVLFCYDLTQDPKTSPPRRVEGLWTGQAATPFVEVRLVEP